ncbi:MAG TPA: hypothetical protein VGY14_05085 [Methyloceanibacter sp.]|jgi:hypothetical protein|nr:hypothetical protein [Methyloceanibacter sp.]
MSNRGAATVLCCALLSALLAEPTLSAEKETPKSAALTETKEAPLAYISVAGAPGDGEQALSAALAKRLSAAGVKQVTALSANVYSVEGIVKVTAAKGGKQAVRIDWTIFGPDGATLGGVSQTKLVRKGSLDKKWGVAADAAARAAANEIAKLLPLKAP